MNDTRQRQKRSLKALRILAWVTLPVGVVALVLGALDVAQGQLHHGIANLVAGAVQVALGITCLRISYVLQKHLAADEQPTVD